MSYFAITSLIVGTVAASNLSSLQNPVGSARKVFLLACYVDGIPTSGTIIPFLYTLGRITGVATVGTLLTNQKSDNADPNAVSEARQSPTAVAAAGNISSTSPGIVGLAAAGIPMANLLRQPGLLYEAKAESPGIILNPGQGILVRAAANAVIWNHFVNWEWNELLI